MVREYAHEEMDQEVNAIAGYYTLDKEVRLPFGDREILYIVGSAVIDNSCCGVGGCGFAIIPGYVVSWKSRVDDQGRYVSEVEPIENRSVKQDVSRLIQDCELATQVQFW